MRGLQFVLAGLPGGGLHHDGTGGDGQAEGIVGDAERALMNGLRSVSYRRGAETREENGLGRPRFSLRLRVSAVRILYVEYSDS